MRTSPLTERFIHHLREHPREQGVRLHRGDCSLLLKPANKHEQILGHLGERTIRFGGLAPPRKNPGKGTESIQLDV